MLREDFKNITINDLLDRNEISIRTSNCCFKAKFNSVFDIVKYYEEGNSFFNIRNAGKRTSLELQDLCSKYISQIGVPVEIIEGGLEEEKNQKRQDEIKELIETDFINAIDNKLIDVKDIIDYLTINQKAILEEKYNKLVTKYSIRTINRLQAIGFEAFVALYLFQNDKELLKVKNLGEKSLAEAVDLKNRIKNEFSYLINLPEEDLIRLELVHQKGETMLNDFVFDFYKQNNHLPMFWILEQYIINDSSRKIDILTNTFNIVQNKQVFSLEKIAEKHNITRERARQIRSDVFRKTFEITDEIIEYGKNNSDLIKYNQLLQNKNDWAYILEILNETNLNQESFKVRECLRKEQCHLSFEFLLQITAYLFRDTFSLFGGFEISNRDRIWENTFLIRKEFTSVFDFEKFIEEFKNHIVKNETEYDLNIEDYLTNSACWTSVIDLNKFDDIVSIIKDILLYEFRLYSNFDGLITILATKKRNPLDVIYEILQKNGNPMHLHEIFIEFKKILPEHKYTEASQLRSWLQRHEAISFQNRKSVYTLKEWGHIKSGTIRDAIVEFLSKNDLPQRAEDITEYVLQHFPKTNIASVRATMFIDTQKRFSFYEDNLFGLVSKEYPTEYEIIIQEGQRKAFEQRLYDLEKFLSENDHFPFSSSNNEEEISLYRWWRIQNQDTKLSERQKADIDRIKIQYADFDTDKNSYDWFRNLNRFKLFLLENCRLPSAIGSEKFLYGWFRRAKDDFNNQRLNEKQRRKYAELFKEINYAER